MSSLASMVINLLIQENSCNTNEDKVLKSFVCHINSSNICDIVINSFLECNIHSRKHHPGNENKGG